MARCKDKDAWQSARETFSGQSSREHVIQRSASYVRDAIVSAYNQLVLATRRARPPIAHVIRDAGVARSTLYRHFADRDALLLEAMDGALVIIADAATADHANYQLVTLLEHFWEHRRSAPDVFNDRFAIRLTRALAARIQERAPQIERNDAMRIADAQIGLVRLWTSGETPGSASALAEKMVAGARALRMAYR